jgi:SEC-C motif
MGKKNRRSLKREKWRKVKPDETFSFGPFRITRYGRFVTYENFATPNQHAAFLKHVDEVHKDTIRNLGVQIAELQAAVSKYDPIELMHRAVYMVLPLFLQYYSENQYESEETYFLPAVEYLQYLISRTPSRDMLTIIDEQSWKPLWTKVIKILHLTQEYLFTRKPRANPPSEIDELRFAVDSRRFAIRIRRYPIYFAEHLRDSLQPFESAVQDAYGISVELLVRGLEEIQAYEKTGIIDRYLALRTSHEAMMDAIEGLEPSQAEGVDLQEILHSAGLESLLMEVRENARLALTSAAFDITEVSSLPNSILSLLSVQPGESILTSLTGPDHDDLSPLTTSILHDKPFVKRGDRCYYFYHSGLEDRITEIIERDIFQRYPDQESTLRRRRDDHIEKIGADLLVSLVRPDKEYRNVYYPNPDQPGNLTELDALLIVDDILFLIEVKAGGLSAGARRGAPQSLFDELADTIGAGQRQSERAEKYIKSTDEVAFFDMSGQHETCRIRGSNFRRIFRIVVTREDLGWVGAQLAIMSVIEPTLSSSFPWHVSLDDLRAVTALFQDSNLRFVHFLERRLQASKETSLNQHDEIEHIGLYNKINFYHDLPVRGMDRMTFDASWMRDVDKFFADKYRGESPTIPKQQMPPRLAGLLDALRDSGIAGRFAAASVILDMDETSRNDLDRALGYLDAGATRQRSVRVPFTVASHGITLSYARDELWQQELVRSAAQMHQSQCSIWIVVQLTGHSPYIISAIETLVPGRFSDEKLAPGFHYIEERVREELRTERPGRNDRCPCGSGKKYKRCHGQ